MGGDQPSKAGAEKALAKGALLPRKHSVASAWQRKGPLAHKTDDVLLQIRQHLTLAVTQELAGFNPTGALKQSNIAGLHPLCGGGELFDLRLRNDLVVLTKGHAVQQVQKVLPRVATLGCRVMGTAKATGNSIATQQGVSSNALTRLKSETAT